MRALAKDREQRFQSAEEFREHLLAAFTGSPATMESPLAAVTSSVDVVEPVPADAVPADAGVAEPQVPAPQAPAEDDFEALLFGTDQRTTVMPAAAAPVEPTPVAPIMPAEPAAPAPAAPAPVATAPFTPAQPTPIAAPSDEFLDGPSTNPFKSLGVELPTVTGSTPQPVLARMNKPSKGLIWGSVSGAAVLIIGLLVWLGSFGGFNLNVNPNAGIQVADVTNQAYDSAVTTLTGQKLLVSKVTEASETIPKDFVIRTDPPAGTAVPENTTVTVYVSAGKNTVLVPNLVGLTEPEAVAALTTAKLVVGTITQANSPSVEAGKVISTLPAMNSQIEEGGTVNLVISDGKVEVPDVRNLSISDARSILTGVAVGFTVVIETDPNPCDGTPGTIVVDQSIEPGLATQRSEIVLTVACNP
jgi:serine/threonine-protein kinase